MSCWAKLGNNILSFNLKEQLMLLLQNVNEVKQSMPAFAASVLCDSTKQNGLITIDNDQYYGAVYAILLNGIAECFVSL